MSRFTKRSAAAAHHARASRFGEFVGLELPASSPVVSPREPEGVRVADWNRDRPVRFHQVALLRALAAGRAGQRIRRMRSLSGMFWQIQRLEKWWKRAFDPFETRACSPTCRPRLRN